MAFSFSTMAVPLAMSIAVAMSIAMAVSLAMAVALAISFAAISALAVLDIESIENGYLIAVDEGDLVSGNFDRDFVIGDLDRGVAGIQDLEQ